MGEENIGLLKSFQSNIENGEAEPQNNATAESGHIQIICEMPETWQVSRKVCIFRVLKCMRIRKQAAYDPLVISFGPYHQGKDPELHAMDQYKVEAVRRMLAGSKKNESNLTEKIEHLESKIRECYAEPIEQNRKNLSCMFTKDGCFILEYFKSASITRDKSDDLLSLFFHNTHSPVFQNMDIQNSMFSNIKVDILKLENQIPLFVLLNLLEIEVGKSEHRTPELAALLYDPGELECPTRKPVTTELAALLSTTNVFRGYPFNPLLSTDEAKSKLQDLIEKTPRPFHLLDLYRIVVKHILTPVKGGQCGRLTNVALRSSGDARSNPSAKLLEGAGVTFQRGKLGFEERMFGKGTFSLPQINVDDTTETLLRNLMAYEECQRCSSNPEETVISHYVRLLDCLIDSKEDVFVLRNAGVITSLEGSDDHIASMFNHLATGTTFSPINELEEVMKEARNHYNNNWKVWMSEFQEAHCSKPWYIVSLLAAIALLVMTLIQTLNSAK